MKLTSLLYSLLFAAVILHAQQVNIVPKPASVKMEKGNFSINPATQLVVTGSELNKTAELFNTYLNKYYGFQLAIVTASKKSLNNAIVLSNNKTSRTIAGAYHLTISKNKIAVEGEDAAGVFYGIQSLIQLLPFEKTKALAVPQLKIEDSARFVYRGMHLDVGRHFYDVDFVKKCIDLIALYKLNTFHWHLTEDQGWRIEIKKYSKLTEIGANRNGTIIGRYPGKGNNNKAYGGFYTQDQIKEVVAYAAERYINVIPEIELPGHSSAAIASYTWLSCFPGRSTNIPLNMVSIKSVEQLQQENRIKLVQETWGVFDDVFCAGKDSTFVFLQDVLDEVMDLFPSKYIHIGGDECPKTFWKQCPNCQKRMKENGLKDEHALQSYFIQRIEKYVNSKGRQIIGWDEILEGGLAPNATVMSWRGEQGGIEAAKQHHAVIMTPGSHCYFDHAQSKHEDSVTIGGYLPIQTVYGYDPTPAQLSDTEAKYILGAQANVWTEYINNTAKAEYMILPRLSAISEVLWANKANKDWNNFEQRLSNEIKRYDWMNLNYSKAYLTEK
jgi:hexosaminidase